MDRSGNPFVDMGLLTIAALSEKGSIAELSLDDFDEVFNKYDIAQINKNTKSFTMVFGTNGPLYQNAYKPHNQALYKKFLGELLEAMKDDQGTELCEICGDKHSFDIDKAWRNSIAEFGFKAKEKKYVGRDFFPLIGSIGNDAQALPGAARVVNICPKCLFAVNYIPLGTMLIKARLICVESTSEVLALELISDIVHENLTRISGGNKEILGKKEGSIELYTKLLSMFNRLQRVKKYEKLPESSALYLWTFSNSGTGADCEIIEIPDRPLKFLWEITRKSQDFKNEFLGLIGRAKGTRIFDAITYGEDYEGLYPKGKYRGVIPKFYEYYQIIIVEKSFRALNFARKIAFKMLEGKDNKEIGKLQRSDIFKEQDYKSMARKAINELVLEGKAESDDYINLFNRTGSYLSTDQYEAFNCIMYYLYNYDSPEIREEDIKVNLQVESRKMDVKIRKFAELYFYYYVEDKKGLHRGIERFKKDILDKFNDFNEYRLREAFAKLAELYECNEFKFNYDDWLEFIADEDGNRRIYELLFQLRLAFSELYRKYNKEEEKVI